MSYGTNIRSGHELKNVPALLSGGGAKEIKHGGTLYFLKKIPLANYWLTFLQQAVQIENFSHSTAYYLSCLSDSLRAIQENSSQLTTQLSRLSLIGLG